MGDTGSLSIGFILAIVAMGTSYTKINAAGIFAPLLILAIPIYETVFVSIIRILKKKNPFLGSKDHFPLRLEKAGCHVHKSGHVNAPIIEEFPVTLECECVSYSDETGILVGKIVSMQADEAVLTDGVVDYDKLQPIIFDIATKTYRLVGPVVGKAFHDGLKLKG